MKLFGLLFKPVRASLDGLDSRPISIAARRTRALRPRSENSSDDTPLLKSGKFTPRRSRQGSRSAAAQRSEANGLPTQDQSIWHSSQTRRRTCQRPAIAFTAGDLRARHQEESDGSSSLGESDGSMPPLLPTAAEAAPNAQLTEPCGLQGPGQLPCEPEDAAGSRPLNQVWHAAAETEFAWRKHRAMASACAGPQFAAGDRVLMKEGLSSGQYNGARGRVVPIPGRAPEAEAHLARDRLAVKLDSGKVLLVRRDRLEWLPEGSVSPTADAAASPGDAASASSSDPDMPPLRFLGGPRTSSSAASTAQGLQPRKFVVGQTVYLNASLQKELDALAATVLPSDSKLLADQVLVRLVDGRSFVLRERDLEEEAPVGSWRSPAGRAANRPHNGGRHIEQGGICTGVRPSKEQLCRDLLRLTESAGFLESKAREKSALAKWCEDLELPAVVPPRLEAEEVRRSIRLPDIASAGFQGLVCPTRGLSRTRRGRACLPHSKDFVLAALRIYRRLDTRFHKLRKGSGHVASMVKHDLLRKLVVTCHAAPNHNGRHVRKPIPVYMIWYM